MIQAREHAPVASSPWKTNPTRRYAPGRVCANEECTQVLAFDNPGPLCGPCQRAKETREFKAAQERAAEDAAKPKRGAKPQERRAMEVGGVKLVPVHLPGRGHGHGTDWSAVVREFIDSGEECCEVTHKGLLGKGIFGMLRSSLKGSNEAYPTVRKGVCYLVRIASRSSTVQPETREEETTCVDDRQSR